MSEEANGPDDPENITNKEAWDFFLDGPRDVFTCDYCGSNAHRGNPPDMPGALYAEVDNEPAIVCVECNDKYDWGTIEARIRDRRCGVPKSPIDTWIVRLRDRVRPALSRIPIALSVHDVPPDRRGSLVPEQTVFLGRLGAVLGLAAIVLVGITVFATLAGALFVSPGAGTNWLAITVSTYREWGLFLVTHPYLILGGLGLGYLAHLVEYQRHIGEPADDLGRSRPRWHYLTFFAAGGLMGWLGWLLSQFGYGGPALPPAGVLIWTASAFGLVYFLHETLLEDRWSYGLPISAPLWKFPVQFALGLMLLDGVLRLPGPDWITFAVAIVPPVIGLLYATRRYLAFTERWMVVRRRVRRVTDRWRQVAPWPATPSRPGPVASPSTSQFGRLDEAQSDGTDQNVDATSSIDREEELRQTREWASYLETELHDREEQMQDLEARLAQVRQELSEAREGESADGPTTDERDDLLTDLFDIRDNFQRALDAESVLDDDATADLSEGIELIDSQIRSILEREGVEEIDTSGEVDPEKHMVIETVPAADADPGEIVDVYQQGYRQDERILRAAQVVVAEEPDTGEGAEPPDDESRINRGDDAA